MHDAYTAFDYDDALCILLGYVVLVMTLRMSLPPIQTNALFTLETHPFATLKYLLHLTFITHCLSGRRSQQPNFLLPMHRKRSRVDSVSVSQDNRTTLPLLPVHNNPNMTSPLRHRPQLRFTTPYPSISISKSKRPSLPSILNHQSTFFLS